MKRDTTVDLDRLARGESIDQAAFLDLLGDPDAQAELEQAARLREILAPGQGLPQVPDSLVMDVTWDELARHAEGSLDDPTRRLAVEVFLNQHFPEALRAWSEADTVLGPTPAGRETVIENPEPPRP